MLLLLYVISTQLTIKYLKEITDIQIKRSEKENNYIGFSVDEGNEIIPLYDIRHLLKGMRNNLVKYNCHYSIDGCEKEASWSHIVKLYEFELR